MVQTRAQAKRQKKMSGKVDDWFKQEEFIPRTVQNPRKFSDFLPDFVIVLFIAVVVFIAFFFYSMQSTVYRYESNTPVVQSKSTLSPEVGVKIEYAD